MENLLLVISLVWYNTEHGYYYTTEESQDSTTDLYFFKQCIKPSAYQVWCKTIMGSEDFVLAKAQFLVLNKQDIKRNKQT